MPVNVISKIKQFNNALFPILDDVDLEGGLRVVEHGWERDEFSSVGPRNRFAKIGMLVRVLDDLGDGPGTLYSLNSDGNTWSVFSGSGGGGSFVPGEDPVLLIYLNETTLLADITSVVGTLAFAENEETLWVKATSGWIAVTSGAVVRFYATQTSLLADITAPDDILGIALDTLNIFIKRAGLWLDGSFRQIETVNFNVNTPLNNQILLYNQSTGEWINATLPDTGATTLDELTDTSLNSPLIHNDVLQFDSGLNAWINKQFEIGTPTDGQYGGSESVSGLEITDSIADAFDKVDTVLEKLAPAAPPNLSAASYTISGTYSARETLTGNLVTNVTTDTTPTASTTIFGRGESGTVEFTIDTNPNGSVVLTSEDDSGIYSGLIISENLYNGFWQGITASTTALTPLTIGQHTFQISHSNTGTKSITFYIDNSVSPIANIDSAIASYNSPIDYISGVPTLQTGSPITIQFDAINTVGTYYNTTIATADTNVGSPVSYSPTGSNPNTSNIILQPTVANNQYQESVTATVTVYSANGSSNTGNLSVAGVRVDTKSDESSRVYAGTGTYPVSYGSAFDSSQSLVTEEELQLINAKFQYPSGDYTSASGPNYNSLTFTGTRWVIFEFPSAIVDDVNITINIQGSTGFSLVEDPDLDVYVKIDGTKPTVGWIDANAPYPGVGNPTNNGDAALVIDSSTATSRVVTFGAAEKTGTVWVRIGLPSSSSKTFSGVSII